MSGEVFIPQNISNDFVKKLFRYEWNTNDAACENVMSIANFGVFVCLKPYLISFVFYIWKT